MVLLINSLLFLTNTDYFASCRGICLGFEWFGSDACMEGSAWRIGGVHPRYQIRHDKKRPVTMRYRKDARKLNLTSNLR